MSSPKERAAWSPSSWRSLPQEQAVPYPPGHEDELRAARDRLASLPPLVSSREVEDLRQHLADVQRGQAFLLQGTLALARIRPHTELGELSVDVCDAVQRATAQSSFEI